MNRYLSASKKFFSVLTVLATVITPFASYVPSASAASLFSDGFESTHPKFLGWTSVDTSEEGRPWGRIASHPYEGSGIARVEGRKDHDVVVESVLRKEVSTLGQTNITLSYAYRVEDRLESDDHVYVEWSRNGGATWEGPLADYSNLVEDKSHDDRFWHTASIAIPGAANLSEFQFRFRSHMSSGSDKFELDAVSLTGDEREGTGTLIIQKIVPGEQEVNYTQFSFSLDEGLATPFEGDGTNEISGLTSGRHTVREVAGNQGYTTTYGGTCDPQGNVTVVAGQTVTCTITNTTVPPAHITIKKQVNTAVSADDVFGFGLRNGDNAPLSTSIAGPALADSFFDVFFTTSDGSSAVQVQETSMPSEWAFQSVVCSYDEQVDGQAFIYDGSTVGMTVYPGDHISCEFTNNKNVSGGHRAGTLVIEKYIRGGTKTFGDFGFSLGGEHDRFDVDGRNEYIRQAGTYQIQEDLVEGYAVSYSGACDAQGMIMLVSGAPVVCKITNTANGWQEGDGEIGPAPTSTPEPTPTAPSGGGSAPTTGTLIVQKVVLLSSVSYSEFGFSVASQSVQFEEDGTNSVILASGSYAVTENPAPGYTTAYGGACDAQGNVIVVPGQTVTCVITNTLGVGGFNPGSDVPAPTPSPTPSPTPNAPASGGDGSSPSDRSLGSQGNETTPTPSPSDAPVASGSDNQVAAAGVILGLDLCSSAGHAGWWATLLALAAVLLWFGRRRGVMLWLIVAYVVIATLWAWQLCGFGYAWSPVVFGVVIWLLSAPRPPAHIQQ